jgi:hypothetical protein
MHYAITIFLFSPGLDFDTICAYLDVDASLAEKETKKSIQSTLKEFYFSN